MENIPHFNFILMQKFLLVFVLGLLSFSAFSQVYVIRADTLKVYKQGGSAEFVLQNKTKDTLGFLENMGNGRTEFHTVITSSGLTPSNTINQYLNGYKSFVNFNTDSISEGTANKYFTVTRAQDAISLTTSGSPGDAATYIGGILNIPTGSTLQGSGSGTFGLAYWTDGVTIAEASTFIYNSGADRMDFEGAGFRFNPSGAGTTVGYVMTANSTDGDITWQPPPTAPTSPSNTPNQYLNGYNSFVNFNTDSIPQGASNFYVPSITSGEIAYGTGSTIAGSTHNYWDNTSFYDSITTPSNRNLMQQSFVAYNPVAATSGNPAYGGAFRSAGHAFASSVSTYYGYQMYDKPLNSGSVPRNQLVWEHKNGNGAWTQDMLLNDLGILNVGGAVNAPSIGGGIAASSFQLSNSGYFNIQSIVQVSANSSLSQATSFFVQITSGTNTQTLPTISATGYLFILCNTGSGTVTIVPSGTDVLYYNGTTSSSFTLNSGKTAWFLGQSLSGTSGYMLINTP